MEIEHLEDIAEHQKKVPVFLKIIAIAIIIGNSIFLISFMSLVGKYIIDGTFLYRLQSNGVMGYFYQKLCISAVASLFSIIGAIYILQKKRIGRISCLFGNLVWILIQTLNLLENYAKTSLIILIVVLVSSILLILSNRITRFIKDYQL